MRPFLRRHRLHPVEVVLLVLGALLAIYRVISVAVPLPTLPSELWLPALLVIVTGLYLTERSRGWAGQPELRVASEVEADIAYACFRLRFWNDQGPVCRPRVSVERVVNDHGKVLLQSVPLELEWTNHPGVRAELGPRDRNGQTVAIVWLQPWPDVAGAPQWVSLYGRNNHPFIGAVADFLGGSFTVDIAADVPEYDIERIEHSFRFLYDENESLHFRPERVN